MCNIIINTFYINDKILSNNYIKQLHLIKFYQTTTFNIINVVV